jgi:hypothetical protein
MISVAANFKTHCVRMQINLTGGFESISRHGCFSAAFWATYPTMICKGRCITMDCFKEPNVYTGLFKKKYTLLKIYFTKKLLTLNPCPVYGWKRNLSKFWSESPTRCAERLILKWWSNFTHKWKSQTPQCPCVGLWKSRSCKRTWTRFT